jgi:N-acetyl-gamma-glutamyl-phosphate reductase
MNQRYENVKKDVQVGVVGGSGYAGLELVNLLWKHPRAELRVCFSSHPSFSFSDYLPSHAARAIPVVDVKSLSEWAPQLDTVFLATPVEISLDLAPKLLAAGTNVIDLSGAFRLTGGTAQERMQAYREWYQLEHPCPELLDRAIYGLLPWQREEKSAFPRLVANPGCYATAILMALLPLLKRNLIEAQSVVIDAKSGTSGAGRKATENLLFTEVEGECLPYRVGGHQHLPEIRQFAAAISGKAIDPFFATHLLSVRRGIIAGIYARMPPAVTELDITSAYALDYADYGLVQWGALGKSTSRSDAYALSMKRVVGTALTRVYYRLAGNQLYLFSLIDNLVKGAAGQAIENFNNLKGLPLEMGLGHLEGVL